MQSRFPALKPFQSASPIAEQAVLDAVKNDTLFGLIECDIHVPNRLKDHFSELQPIFKNVSVARQQIGPFMCEYAVKNKLLTRPCSTLFGSFFGEKIILAAPLVKWYLKHGLVVDNVTLIEYTPKQRFKQFGEQVSNARRQGDLDSSQSILADTFKLLGNSAYGKSLTKIAKHRDIHYITSEQTKKLVNESHFQKLN